MDDKKFDEIMQKYVSGKSRGMEADFSKFKEQKYKKVAKKYKNRLVWATVSCIIVIAVTLSIVLPLTLPANKGNDRDNQTFDIQYFEEEEIVLALVESPNEFYSKYNISAILPTIQNQDIGYRVLKSRMDDNVVGAFIEIDVFDEYFDIVRMHIVPENFVLKIMLDYESFTSESIWNNNIVKYIVEHDEDSGCNSIRMFFTMNGYKYYLDAQYYGDLSIVEILDLIF